MTMIRQYLDAFKAAVAVFLMFMRPPQHELGIIEELPAGATPQPIPDGDVQPVERPRFYFMCFAKDQSGVTIELDVADIARLMDLDVDLFLAQPAAVKDAFRDNMGAGLWPHEALAAAQTAPTDMN